MASRRGKQLHSHRTKKFFLPYETYKRVKSNFFIGIARGIGSAIGFTILGAVILVIMQVVPLEKIPLIGNLIRQLDNMQRSGTLHAVLVL